MKGSDGPKAYFVHSKLAGSLSRNPEVVMWTRRVTMLRRAMEKKPSIKQQIRGIERCDILGVVLCVYCIPPTFAVAACRRV